MPSYATIIRPKTPAKPVSAVPAPTSTSYDFSQDALTPQANRMGTTPQAASADLSRQMEERTVAESRANPGQIAYGAQTGSLQNGQDQVPVTFQAFTRAPAVNINGRQVEQENIPWLIEQQQREQRNAEDAARQRAALSSPMMVDYGDGRGPVRTTPVSSDGSGAPNFTAPPNQYDDEITRLSKGRTDAEYEADLEAQRAAIESEYRQNLARVEEQGRNKKASRFSDLAGLMVNPLSSGAQSVANSSEAETEDARRYETQQKDAKIAIARQEVMGKKSDQQRNYLATLIAERDRNDKNANAQYERSFNTWKENNAQALRLAQEARAGKEFTRDEKNGNRAFLTQQLTSFGSEAFGQFTAQQKRDLEASAGVPAGFIDSQAAALKAKEAATNVGEGFTLSPGGSRFDSKGNLIASSPKDASSEGFTLSPGQTRIGADGKVIYSAPGSTEVEPPKPQSINGVTAVWNDATKTFEPVVLPTVADPAATQKTKEVLDLAKSILGNKSLSNAVGPISSKLPTMTGRRADVEADVERLKSLLTLDNLGKGYLKGAISDRDLEVLKNAATSLNYGMSEEGFKKELGRIIEKIETASPNVTAPTPQSVTPTELQELRRAFPGVSDADLLRFSTESQTSLKGTNNLGSLSSKYESGARPGAIGYDSTGGWSYGTYQLAHNNAQEFVKSSPYADAFKGLAFNSKAFQDRWKQVASIDPQGFGQAQHSYIAKTHFEPQAEKLTKAGIDVSTLPKAVQDVIWSTAVQHGPGTDIVVRAFKALKPGSTTADLIQGIYNARWSGGKNFASSTEKVRKSVYNRFFGPGGEMQTALKSLA